MVCTKQESIPEFIDIKRYKEDGKNNIFNKNESGTSMKIVACIAIILLALIIFIISFYYLKTKLK
jgi:biopolymer transport protein ExbD